jgi:RNA polymerase sigma-32 factor
MFVDFIVPSYSSLNETYGLSSIKILSPEEEYELTVKYKETKDVGAAHALTVSHLPYVVRIASKYSAYFRVSVHDLIHEGLIGLMRALKIFDPYKGCRFISFASLWVLREIKEFIMRCSKEFRVGTTIPQRKLFFRVDDLKKSSPIPYDQRVDNLAEELGVPVDEVTKMVDRLNEKNISLDAPMNSDTETPFSEVVSDTSPSPEELLIKRDRASIAKELVREGLSRLTEMEKKVIQKRYFNEESLTYQEIGDELGISKQRVHGLENSALKRLKMIMCNRLTTKSFGAKPLIAKGYPTQD